MELGSEPPHDTAVIAGHTLRKVRCRNEEMFVKPCSRVSYDTVAIAGTAPGKFADRERRNDCCGKAGMKPGSRIPHDTVAIAGIERRK